MATVVNGGGTMVLAFQIDEAYEFFAPRFFDFMNEETEEEIESAELWFETALSCAPSPFMPKIKVARSVKLDSLCDFGEVEQIHKESGHEEATKKSEDLTSAAESNRNVPELAVATKSSGCHQQEVKDEINPSVDSGEEEAIKKTEDITSAIENIRHVPELIVATESKGGSQQEVKEGKTPTELESGHVEATKQREVLTSAAQNTRHVPELVVSTDSNGGHEQEAEVKDRKNQVKDTEISEDKTLEDGQHPHKDKSLSSCNSTSLSTDKWRNKTSSALLSVLPSSRVAIVQGNEASTPKAQRVSVNSAAPTNAKNQTARRIASMISKPTAVKPKSQSPSFQSAKSTKPKSVTRCHSRLTEKNTVVTDIAQENQAIKRQKLEDGKSRQILNVKNRVLPHKSKPSLNGGTNIFSSSVKEAAPFLSMAEMVNKFQSKTRDLDFSQNRSLSHDETASMIQRRPKLTLTRPKEPKLETAQRVRAVRVKSSAELEAEMLAKIPTFKARPVNKKIMEAPSLPALPRSAPQPPEFQVFHLKTMERANQHAGTSTSVLTSLIESSSQNQGKPHKLTEPRPPLLETSLRARPPKIKSSHELELEELERIPKFMARPLNKKILESKGDLGLFCNSKRQVTTPQEFHFATDERIGPPMEVVEHFDKLSLHSESHHDDKQEVPRITIPNPFHLHTEERGLEKDRQLALQVLQKQLEEERARLCKANPYPYTTDFPAIPPKPEPKQCTKPESFQLESLLRHEEELQRKVEEKERMEKEEAQKRVFRAQPILKDDPIPLPLKARKPLTEVQEFVLHVDHRVVARSDFDRKILEKDITYKRLREESESTKAIEEEKAVKQMRRTMVPHARPIPNFNNPFLPQKSSKEATKPKSPNLHVTRREQRWRASHIR